MNKICTSIEQSKKLIELGIDINTADLTIIDLPIQGGDRFKFISSRLPNDTFPSITDGKSEKVPAWSLSALIQVLPITIVDSWTDYCLMLDIKAKMPRYVKYGDVYHPEFPWDFKKQSLLDSIVESIFWLHNNNYLNGSNR